MLDMPSIAVRLRIFRLVAISLLVSLATAFAGTVPIAIAPVSIKLDTATEYAAIEVSNRGEQPTGIEIEVMRVKWIDGQEQYEPTKDFVVSPPAFRVQATKGRMVRFRYVGTRQDMEGFYRMFVRQLPDALDTNQVTMIFNLGVPIFVAPVNSRPALTIGSNELRNTGNITLSVGEINGQSCADGPQKIQARIAPLQRVPLQKDLTKCATSAQTDRGLIPITSP